MMAKQDPVTIACYTHDHGLLEQPSWKFLCRIAKCQCFVNSIMNAIKCCKDPNQVCYKFGVCLHWTYAEATQLDTENGSTYWQDAIQCELDQIFHIIHFATWELGLPLGQNSRKLRFTLSLIVRLMVTERPGYKNEVHAHLLGNA